MLETPIQSTFVGRMRQLQARLGNTTSGEWVDFFHCPNEGKRGPKAQNEARALGVSSGVPDLFVLFSCPLTINHQLVRTLVIEFKGTGGKPSADQRDWLYRLGTLPNTLCLVVNSLKQAEDLALQVELAFTAQLGIKCI